MAKSAFARQRVLTEQGQYQASGRDHTQTRVIHGLKHPDAWRESVRSSRCTTSMTSRPAVQPLWVDGQDEGRVPDRPAIRHWHGWAAVRVFSPLDRAFRLW